MDPKDFNVRFNITEDYLRISTAYVSKNPWNKKNFILWIDDQDKVFARGDNSWGQLGLGHTNKVDGQIEIESLSKRNVCDFYEGNSCMFAISRDGKVFSWGWNYTGQLGIGRVDKDNVFHMPIRNLLPSNIKKISCGDHHYTALTQTGEVYGWGLNDQLQLKVETNESIVSKPIKISMKIFINFLFCYLNSSLSIDSDGKLHLWGGHYDDKEIESFINSHNLKFKRAVLTEDNIFLISSGSIYEFKENDDGQFQLTQMKFSGNKVKNLAVDIDGNLLIQSTKVVFKLLKSCFKETRYLNFQHYFIEEFNITFGTYTNPFSTAIGGNLGLVESSKNTSTVTYSLLSVILPSHDNKSLDETKAQSKPEPEENQERFLKQPYSISAHKRLIAAVSGAILGLPFGPVGAITGFTAGIFIPDVIYIIKEKFY